MLCALSHWGGSWTDGRLHFICHFLPSRLSRRYRLARKEQSFSPAVAAYHLGNKRLGRPCAITFPFLLCSARPGRCYETKKKSSPFEVLRCCAISIELRRAPPCKARVDFALLIRHVMFIRPCDQQKMSYTAEETWRRQRRTSFLSLFFIHDISLPSAVALHLCGSCTFSPTTTDRSLGSLFNDARLSAPGHSAQSSCTDPKP